MRILPPLKKSKTRLKRTRKRRVLSFATTSKERRVSLISNQLDEYIPNPRPPLVHHNPYTLLIATLLSARCTDVMVNRVTPHLFKEALSRFPEKSEVEPFMMQTVSFETVRAIIRPCGLSPQKALAILELSKILVEKHGGKVPSSLEELEELPGVGHKTASVVLVQGFQLPAFPVDTHIFRSARRWGLSLGATVKKVESDLKAIFPSNLWGKRHLQMVLFARSYCPAKRHDLETCPICSKLK